MPKNKIILILAAVVFLGAFLRFYGLGNNSFVADEFLDINASYGYFKTGEWRAWDFNLEKPAERINIASDERAWAYRIQPAFLFKFLPPTEAAARAVSALWGTASVIFIYLAAAYFTRSKIAGLIAALLFALSLDGIEFSRKMRMYAMFFPVFLAFSWLAFRFLEEKYAGRIKIFKSFYDKTGFNALYILPAFLLGILSLHLHQLTANIIIIGASYFLVHAALIAAKEKKYLNRYSLMLISGIVFFMAAYALAPAKVAYFTAGLKFFNNHTSYFAKIFGDYSHWLLAFLFVGYGFYYLYKKGLQKEALWAGLSALVPLLLAVFIWRRNPGAQYIYFAKSFVIILAAAGICGFLEYLKNNLANFSGKKYFAVLILIFLVLPANGYFFQKDNAYRQTSQSENPNYRKIFNYVKKHRLENDVVITRNFRNYYLSGAKIPVMSYGGELAEEKLSLEETRKIINENASGWAVISENDERYVSKDAREYLERNTQKINAIEVRGKVSVYRWE